LPGLKRTGWLLTSTERIVNKLVSASMMLPLIAGERATQKARIIELLVAFQVITSEDFTGFPIDGKRLYHVMLDARTQTSILAEHLCFNIRIAADKLRRFEVTKTFSPKRTAHGWKEFRV
jgi:hypothetical protein